MCNKSAECLKGLMHKNEINDDSFNEIHKIEKEEERTDKLYTVAKTLIDKYEKIIEQENSTKYYHEEHQIASDSQVRVLEDVIDDLKAVINDRIDIKEYSHDVKKECSKKRVIAVYLGERGLAGNMDVTLGTEINTVESFMKLQNDISESVGSQVIITNIIELN